MNNFKIKYLKYKTKYLRLKNNIIAGSTTDELQNDWKIFFLGQEIKLDPMYYEDDTEYIQIIEEIKRIKKDEDFDWSNYIIKKRFKNNGPKLKVINTGSEISNDIKEIFIEANETDHIAKAIKNADLKLNTGFKSQIAFIEDKIVYSDGTYEGGLKDGEFHGKGKITFLNGRIEEGKFRNGELIFGKIQYGNLIKNGYFDNRKLTKGYIGNTSESFFEEGNFENNSEEVETLHGQGYRFTSGFEEEGEFEYGVLIEGKKTYVDGHKEVGEFTYGNLYKGTKSDYDGIIEIGEFDDELIKGIRIYPNQLKEEGEFKDGKLNGKGKRYIHGIIFEEGEFENGILIKNKNKRIKLNNQVFDSK